jgi:glycosyltransferase involved in cell wall biosynthesis
VKVLHVSYTFHPDASGGTERYVDGLSRALATRGITSCVAAPAAADRTYEWRGVPVHRFAIDRAPATLGRVYGADEVASRSFARVLDRERPDVVHQHALTSACSHVLAQQAKARRIPVVFTYHTPTVTCLRGTLLHNGTDRCDGRMDADRCTPCTLHGLGVNQRLAAAVDGMPEMVARLAGRLNLEGGIWTALRMHELVLMRQDVARTLLLDADAVVSLTRWVTDLLETNGVSRERIVESPHGVARDAVALTSRTRREPGRVRMAHLGRVDPVKGTRLLIEALRSAPDAAVSLDIFGIVQSDSGRELLGDLQSLAGADVRIQFRAALPPEKVIPALAEYDVVAIPSQWLETGPLVLLEAFAAGVPVIGSDLGGIADKVADGRDGILVRPYDSVEAWAAVMRRLTAEPQLLDGLRRGVKTPRSTGEVAIDMARLYRRLTATCRSGAPAPAAVL